MESGFLSAGKQASQSLTFNMKLVAHHELAGFGGPTTMCAPIRSEEFRKVGEKNQWEVAFRDAGQTRKFMEADYAQMKCVMTYLGVVK